MTLPNSAPFGDILWARCASRCTATLLQQLMKIEFSGRIIFWKGPAPVFFVIVPAKLSSDINAISNHVTYGWGVIPVHVQIGKTKFTTSLFPKDGRYLVPIKASVRRAENLDKGDKITIRFEIR